jgi:hypothetical protein
MKDPLDQMRRLLREHGWEPDADRFRWTLAGCPAKMCAFRPPNREAAHCLEFAGSQVRRVYTTATSLRERLKQLAKK